MITVKEKVMKEVCYICKRQVKCDYKIERHNEWIRSYCKSCYKLIDFHGELK